MATVRFGPGQIEVRGKLDRVGGGALWSTGLVYPVGRFGNIPSIRDAAAVSGG
jgi:hypothetical protein